MNELIFLVEEAPAGGYAACALGHSIFAEAESMDALQAEADALKRLQAETAAELDALRPAILDRAFKGDL